VALGPALFAGSQSSNCRHLQRDDWVPYPTYRDTEGGGAVMLADIDAINMIVAAQGGEHR
jgi:hypothetical protein